MSRGLRACALDVIVASSFWSMKGGVVILHDVGYKALHKGVAALPTEWKRHVVKGQFYKNLVGTVLLHRGYPRSFVDVL